MCGAIRSYIDPTGHRNVLLNGQDWIMGNLMGDGSATNKRGSTRLMLAAFTYHDTLGETHEIFFSLYIAYSCRCWYFQGQIDQIDANAAAEQARRAAGASGANQSQANNFANYAYLNWQAQRYGPGTNDYNNYDFGKIYNNYDWLYDLNTSINHYQMLADANDTMRQAYPPLYPPVDSSHPVTSSYGPRKGVNSGFHKGVDFGTPIGTPVYSAHSGVATVRRGSRSAGNYVKVRGSGITTRYLHLSSISIKNGKYVKAGDRIGYSGNTGYGIFDGIEQRVKPHLHFDVYDHSSGGYIDPFSYRGGYGW